jgi:hypothetical protein
MTKSLKDKAQNKLDLYNRSCTLPSSEDSVLNIQNLSPSSAYLPTWLVVYLVTAPCRESSLDCYLRPHHPDIPSFFRHLTHSLGPSDFLAPVSMLLIDRTVTKAGKSAGLTLDLPLGVIASYDVAIRLDVVLEVVQEIARLVPDLTNPDKTAFLSNL